MADNPDLFVVCKNCGSEVSPYITECPYCGNRLRKRAPNLTPTDVLDDQLRTVKTRRAVRIPQRRISFPTFVRWHKFVPISLIATSIIISILWRSDVISVHTLAIDGKVGSQWWRILTASFVYKNTGYQAVTLFAIAIFALALAHRFGIIFALLTFFAGGAAGMVVVDLALNQPMAAGGNGAALALLTAWFAAATVVRDQRDSDLDYLGVLAFAVVLLLIPIVATESSELAGVTGLLVGAVLGGLAGVLIKPHRN